MRPQVSSSRRATLVAIGVLVLATILAGVCYFSALAKSEITDAARREAKAEGELRGKSHLEAMAIIRSHVKRFDFGVYCSDNGFVDGYLATKSCISRNGYVAMRYSGDIYKIAGSDQVIALDPDSDDPASDDYFDVRKVLAAFE